MGFRIIASIIAAALLVAFISPVVIKIKSVALVVVVLIGLTMMLVDIWQSLKSTDD